MNWLNKYPKDQKPELDAFALYIGGQAKELWEQLLHHCMAELGIKTQLSFSTCSGKPGWNLKLQKKGKSFGTLYPDPGMFQVLIVIPYGLDTEMQGLLPYLSDFIREQYQNAGDFMKQGKWMMFPISTRDILDDYLKIVELKLKHSLV